MIGTVATWDTSSNMHKSQIKVSKRQPDYLIILSKLDDTTYSVVPSVLVILSLFSAIYTFRVRRWRNNGRIRFTVTNDSTYEMGAMLASNILPLVSIGFNTYVALIVFGMIWILGIAVVRAGYIHICPVFLLNGYHLYTDDKGRHVLAKMKKETFNLYIRDNIDGIEVRQLSEKLYIVCDR